MFGFKAADEGIEKSTHGQIITFEYILETNPDILFVIDRDAAVNAEANAKGGGLQSVKLMVIDAEAAL